MSSSVCQLYLALIPKMNETKHRFVILFHVVGTAFEREMDHWDIMVQIGNSLKTWAIEVEPKPNLNAPALQLPNHRFEYLDYEGEISDSRGNVSRWDEGTYSMIQDAEDTFCIKTNGAKLSSTLTFTRISGTNWVLQIK